MSTTLACCCAKLDGSPRSNPGAFGSKRDVIFPFLSRKPFATKTSKISVDASRPRGTVSPSTSRSRIANAVFGTFPKVLVSQRKAQPVFSRLREHRGKCVGNERVKLVNVEKKISSFGFRPVRPRHGADLELGNQKRSDEVRLVSTEFAFA